VGLDGGSFDLLQPWIEKGILPNIRELMKGVSGNLKSTIPPITVPAWSSFMTGMNPAKHGLFDFMIRERNTYRYHPVSSGARRASTLWDIVGQQGGKVVVLNVPTTYPPSKVHGVQVSGYLTPLGKRDFIYPPELLPEIEEKFGEYPLYFKSPSFTINITDSNIDTFLTECKEALDYKFKVTHYLIDKLDPDFLMLHIFGGDQICHWLWHILDEDHLRHSQADFEKHGIKIIDYFRKFDTELGKLTSKADENTSLFVLSDHGFGPLHRFILINVWLLNEGYLALKRNPLTRLRHLLWKLGLTDRSLFTRARSLFNILINHGIKHKAMGVPYEKMKFGYSRRGGLLLTINDIDLSRTKAFCKIGGHGTITINLKGKFPQGCVSLSSYKSLKDEIIDKLKELHDPDTGSLVEGEIFIKEEAYQGKYLDSAPDIVFWTMNNKYLAGSLFGFSSNKVITDPWTGLTGHHKMYGILIGKGKAIRQGTKIKNAEMVDVAPTILYLMGLKIPRSMDGRVLEEIFTEEFRESHNIEFTEAVTIEDRKPQEMTPEEEELILRRLRALGYIE